IAPCGWFGVLGYFISLHSKPPTSGRKIAAFNVAHRSAWPDCRRGGQKRLNTEGTEDHRGNRRSVNVDLLDALQQTSGLTGLKQITLTKRLLLRLTNVRGVGGLGTRLSCSRN